MNQPDLTVLMCCIPERDGSALRKYFDDPRIEFIYLGDNMRMSLGKKRNLLVQMATGKYLVFVDDDDKVHPDYISDLLKGIESGADVINFHVEYSKNGKGNTPVHYSMKFLKDFNEPNRYCRLPNHIMCVKSSIAKKTGYKDMDYGEDAEYSKRLKYYLKTEHNIDKVLYYYLDDDAISKSRFNYHRRR